MRPQSSPSNPMLTNPNYYRNVATVVVVHILKLHSTDAAHTH